jgi:hypothetical protein
MTGEELLAIMNFLRDRVEMESSEAKNSPVITFQAPNEAEMRAAGLNAEGARRMLGVPWWDEMVEDIIETPAMCDPDDPPAQVLEYARDVVSEYIRKRFPLEGE